MKNLILSSTATLVGCVAIISTANAQTIVDPFTTAQAGGGAGATWSSIPSSLFAQRRVQRFNSATASVGSGAWTFAFTTSSGQANLGYRQDASLSTMDLRGIASMSFDITTTGTVNLNWYLEDENDNNLIQFGALVPVTGTSTQTLDFSTATFDPGFDLSKVKGMTVSFTAASSSASANVSNFKYAPVPEPATMAGLGLGALALIRRRRNQG
jgi:hypothetical protein